MLACSLLPPTVEGTDDNILSALEKLHYPKLVSLKMDGVRALRMNDIALASRRFKWIPNHLLCGKALTLPVGLDMELWSPELDYNEIQSIVMSEEHEDTNKIQFHAFDLFNTSGATYINRMHHLSHLHMLSEGAINFDFPLECSNAQELFNHFRFAEACEGEGICFRSPDSPYKQGRSTLKEEYLIKLCRFSKSECRIVGFKEQLLNTNKEKRNALGKMDRSKSIEGMIGKGTLGALECINEHGIRFDVGTGIGLDDALRLKIWLNRDEYYGKTITIKSKTHGVKVKPRGPVFVGFREEMDI